jgi:glycerophosphoryl diester phosphodiesterase
MNMKGRFKAVWSLVAAFMAGLLFLLGGAGAEAARTCGSKAIAHRGANTAKVDENTIRAVERAHKLRANTENDVLLTRDGGFVIIHNRSLRHTTNCRGYVTNRTLANIQRRCHTTPNRMHIPSAFELFRTVAHNGGQILNLEVKGPGWFADDNRPLVRLRNVAKRTGALDQVFFSNDATYRTLTALHHSAPNAKTAWKPDFHGGNVTVRHARRLSADAVMAGTGQWSSRQKVRGFKRAGFRVWVRLGNDKQVWKRNWRLGIRGQLTDEPDGYRRWCRNVV